MRGQVQAAGHGQVEHVVRFQRGQARQQRVEVAGHVQPQLPLLPAVLPGGHRLHAGQGAGAVEFHQQRLPGVVGLEAVGLGRAAVPGAGVDAARAVPVAQRQVVEPRARCAVGRDRVGRVDVLGQHALHRAVRDADAQPARRCLGAVEPGREIAVRVALRQRRAQQGQALRGQLHHARLQRQVHVGRHRAQPRGVAPHALGQRRVVVAGDQHPGAGVARERVEQAPDAACRHGLRVEHVAGHDHRVHRVLRGQRGQAFDGGVAGLGQRHGVLGVEAGVQAADLPVGGVQQAGHRGASQVGGAAPLWRPGPTWGRHRIV